VTDLHDLSALEQGELVRRCEVSAGELAEHYLQRIETLDDVGAFVTIAEERISTCARSLAVEPVGESPLFGVPTAIKDLNLTAGVRTMFGSAAFEDYVPEVSDNVTLSIEAAGMISLGKTNTPEFGSPCYTEPDVAPPAATPWDRTRGAGGSSGGAAAAVAAGLVPVAQGSDGGGSIRIPASCCGIVGFKPSRGVISGAPMYGDPVGLATAGPLARSVRDAAALLDVLAGRRVGDPFWAADGSYLEACDRPVGRLRIARFIEPVITDVAVDAEVAKAWSDASTLLESLGHEIVDVPVPLPREAVPVFETCWAVLTALSVVPPEREGLLRPLTRWLTERGRAVSGPDFGLAIGAMRRFAAQALSALAPFDAVLTPTLAVPPVAVGAIRDDADPARDFENQKRFTPWTSAWNVTGMPAVSLPLHWTPDDLPVGVMLAARPAEDELLLALSAQVEEAVGGFTRRPPGW
jgi:amidase